MNKSLQRSLLAAILLLSASSLFAQRPEPAFADTARFETVVGETPTSLLLGPSRPFYEAIHEMILSATNTLDVCVYSLNMPPFAKALLDAHDRGVKVRMVAYSVDPTSQGGLDKMVTKLKRHKILKMSANKSGIMHNKFMVADNRRVWISSGNFTDTCKELNDNNALIMDHPLLAENYTAEMNEIFEGLHGKKKGYPTPHPEVDMGAGVTLSCYFAPEDNLQSGILREINAATNTIDILAFSLTHAKICSALVKKGWQGVKIRILLDETLAVHPSGRVEWLDGQGLDVRISPNSAQMHHKVFVIDGLTVITGSANFSEAAFNKNDENLLIFKSAPMADALRREFERCWIARTYLFNKWNNPVP